MQPKLEYGGNPSCRATRSGRQDLQVSRLNLPHSIKALPQSSVFFQPRPACNNVRQTLLSSACTLVCLRPCPRCVSVFHFLLLLGCGQPMADVYIPSVPASTAKWRNATWPAVVQQSCPCRPPAQVALKRCLRASCTVELRLCFFCLTRLSRHYLPPVADYGERGRSVE